LHTHLDHFHQKITGQQSVLCLVHLGDGVALFGLLGFQLGFEGGDRFLALLLPIFEVLRGFVRDLVVALLPVIEQLVQFYYASLVLLSHVVRDGRTAGATRSQQDQIQTVGLLDSGRQFNLKVLLSNFLQFLFEFAFLVRILVSHL